MCSEGAQRSVCACVNAKVAMLPWGPDDVSVLSIVPVWAVRGSWGIGRSVWQVGKRESWCLCQFGLLK